MSKVVREPAPALEDPAPALHACAARCLTARCTCLRAPSRAPDGLHGRQPAGQWPRAGTCHGAGLRVLVFGSTGPPCSGSARPGLLGEPPCCGLLDWWAASRPAARSRHRPGLAGSGLRPHLGPCLPACACPQHWHFRRAAGSTVTLQSCCAACACAATEVNTDRLRLACR